MAAAAAIAFGCFQVVTGGATQCVTGRADPRSHSCMNSNCDWCWNSGSTSCNAPARTSTAIARRAIAVAGVCRDRAG